MLFGHCSVSDTHCMTISSRYNKQLRRWTVAYYISKRCCACCYVCAYFLGQWTHFYDIYYCIPGKSTNSVHASLLLLFQSQNEKSDDGSFDDWTSSVVKVPDSWSKGRGFESLLERRENFLLPGHFLCWLLFRYLFHPCVITVARERSWSFCQKRRWQVTDKHAYTLRMWILLNRASALVTTCP